ncbi:MAG: zinc protease [Chloroflexi bacterium]|nr:MAG: zinc protease [Chloroflexota bacterium]
MEPITFKKFSLANGLKVVLHEDHALPLAAVNVWYHVGSRNEEPGKTGFAHLFEHLMFEGSKNHNESFFTPLQKIGANLNGSTNIDRTNYWENVPSNHLELALWLEADRMGFLLDALDQRRFDVQRDVVKNERRQSYENRPYGVAGLKLQAAAYPYPHPYHWPTIGSQEDLDAASLEDVTDFFQRFYSPSNASLAIAGDINIERVSEMVERYFGDIAPGPSVPRAERFDSPLLGQVDLLLYDRVTLPRWFATWPTVPQFHKDEAALTVLTTILSDGKSSRLHKALVYEQQVAQSVGASNGAGEIAGDLDMSVTAAAGHSAQDVEAAARREIERLLTEPPTAKEVERARNRIESQHVRQAANIGGFGGRADMLNAYNVFADDPDLVNRDVDRFMAVQPEDVARVAEQYLGSRHVQMVVLPEPSYSHSTSTLDRSQTPEAASPPTFEPPLPQRGQLANGVNVLVVERHELPLVALGLAISTGGAEDPPAKPGLASFTTTMLQEGTSGRSSLQIAEEFEFIGSGLAASSGREQTIFATETLIRHLPTALEIIADVVLSPTFPEEELTRVRTERLTSLSRLRDDAGALAGRVAPMLLYGPDAPYGHPMGGNDVSVKSLSRDDLVKDFERRFRPEGATLIMVGDTSLEEAMALGEKHLGSWKAKAASEPPVRTEPSPTLSPGFLYLMDKPGAAQSVIRAGYVGVPRMHPDYFPLVVLNHIFGGQFTARLNMNLRQDKGYSYGYRSSIEWHRESSASMIGGSVQTAVTKEAVIETLKEINELKGSRPVTEEEFSGAKSALLQEFPASFETSGEILSRLFSVAAYGLPDDYFRTIVPSIENVSLEDVRRVAEKHVDLENLQLLVVGDQAVVEAGLRELGMPVRLLDHEGRLLD